MAIPLASQCCKESREVLRQHLDHHKWREAAFNTEQLRSQRWMIGSQPRADRCPDHLRSILCVTPQSQALHLKLVVHMFVEGGRRLRPSARARNRLSGDAFDACVDFACIYSAVLTEGRKLASWTQEKEDEVMKAFFQRLLDII